MPPAPTAYSQASTRVGIELEPTALDGDDRAIGRVPAGVAASVGGPPSNVGVSRAPSRRPANSGWGPKPASPKPGGRRSGSGTATGGVELQAQRGRRASGRHRGSPAPGHPPGATRAGADPSSAAPRIQSTSLCSSGTSARRSSQRTPAARQRAEPPLDLVQLPLRRGTDPGPRRPAPVVARSRRLSRPVRPTTARAAAGGSPRSRAGCPACAR